MDGSFAPHVSRSDLLCCFLKADTMNSSSSSVVARHESQRRLDRRLPLQFNCPLNADLLRREGTFDPIREGLGGSGWDRKPRK